MNVIFAWVLISISFSIGLVTSIDDKYKDKAENVSVIITQVLKDSPSATAGLEAGDRIVSITTSGERKNILSVTDIQNTIAESSDELSIEFQRDQITNTLEVLAQDGVIEGKKAIGVSMALVGTVKYGFFQSFIEGAKLTFIQTINIGKGISRFIYGAIRGEDGLFAQVAGPVGIAGMVGQATDMGMSYLLGFIAIISINLAVLNFIPFPAFDGGRVLFVAIEIITRKNIKPIITNWANGIGLALLMLLMVIITYKDIVRLIQ
jgi:regulator of sigma E protease